MSAGSRPGRRPVGSPARPAGSTARRSRVQRIDGLAGAPARDDSAECWDRANVHALNGRYGDYLLAKVGKVFPELDAQVL